jgi:FG-GAP repeat
MLLVVRQATCIPAALKPDWSTRDSPLQHCALFFLAPSFDYKTKRGGIFFAMKWIVPITSTRAFSKQAFVFWWWLLGFVIHHQAETVLSQPTSQQPSVAPGEEPSSMSSGEPSMTPIVDPSSVPIDEPSSSMPSVEPSPLPSEVHSPLPSVEPRSSTVPSPMPPSDWTQIANAITGEADPDRFGSSVALSADGRRMVVASPGDKKNGINSGSVRIFELVNGSWAQIGNTLRGKSFEHFGAAVAISADGSRVAVGSPGRSDRGRVKVFGLLSSPANTGWIQIGNDIIGSDVGLLGAFGSSVAMSADGNSIVAGAPDNDGDARNSGMVAVFALQFTGSGAEWKQRGLSIFGTLTNEFFGRSVAMSADASTIAGGAPGHDKRSGSVRVFGQPPGPTDDWTDWSQIGKAFTGQDMNHESGRSLAMSANGRRIAVSDARGSGSVSVFERQNESWKPVGNTGKVIESAVRDNTDFYSVAMSPDGSSVAVGCSWADGGDLVKNGIVRVFDQPTSSNPDWAQRGNDIIGVANGDGFGTAVALAENGSILAGGAPSNDGNAPGSETGQVRVFALPAPVKPTKGPSIQPSNQPSDSLSIVPRDTPSTAPSDSSSASPSSSPSAEPSIYPSVTPTATGGINVSCDFSTLTPEVPLTNMEQADKLRNDCSLSVKTSGTMPGRVYSNPPINVFDSLNGVVSKHARDDPDLGAPNRACGPILANGQKGPGRGDGGKPFIKLNGGQTVTNPYKNCAPLGNVLIIQNGDIRVEEKANDSPFGGCIEFEFNGLHVTLTNFGLLDKEDPAEITVRYIQSTQETQGAGEFGFLPITSRFFCCCSSFASRIFVSAFE